MLSLQKFIRENSNWANLLAAEPYNLKITIDGDYALLKYNQITSNFNEPICREARGIIIHIPTVQVVRLAFFKFFNIDEVHADKIDWNTAHGSEKIDGSIMTLWHHNGVWHLSTNGTINAYNAQLSNTAFSNFGELFDVAAKNVGLDIASLDPTYNYTFELVSPYNKIVIDYSEPSLYLLSIRNMNNLEEVYPIPSGIAPSVPRPMNYNLNTEEDYRKVVESMGDNHEGIVVRDEMGHRVKIKTLLYFQLHRMVNNNHLTVERVVTLIRANDYEEFLSYFPEYGNYFESVKSQLAEADEEIIRIQTFVNKWKTEYKNAPRKWFAQDIKNSGKGKLSALYFSAYDGKLNEFVAKMSVEKFIRLFDIQ